ncbi:MAG: 1-acyl-sn-glycerol-3-phosphate acyltransferase [Chloroflexi bacterium]|nr:1-acyl-sn-glycerol-3-phosphate acyltransferase [Chloroflexota bacterium]
MADQPAISNSKIQTSKRHYDHARREPVRRVLRWLIDNIAWRWLAKIDRIDGLENLPPRGAAILMINHIAFIDPIVVLGNLPRNIVPMAKVEAYNYPVWGIFPWLWDVIPVHRGEADREALTRALAVLNAGEIVLVAPQGTRQPALRSAKEGIAYLAHKSGAPIIPVAIEGTVGFPSISRRRWSQPGVTVRLGKPFRFKPSAGRLPREALKQMTDEAMYRLASILPEHRRGAYGDLSKATSEYVVEG